MIKRMIKAIRRKIGWQGKLLPGWLEVPAGWVPHGGSRVRPSSAPMGLGVGAQTSPGGPGESGRGGLLWSLAQQ
jgi:hypothetical protein